MCHTWFIFYFTRIHVIMSEPFSPLKGYILVCQSCPLLHKVICRNVRVVLSFTRLHVDMPELSSPKQGYMSQWQSCPLLHKVTWWYVRLFLCWTSPIQETQKSRSNDFFYFYRFLLKLLQHGCGVFQSLTNAVHLLPAHGDFPVFNADRSITIINPYTTATYRCQFNSCYHL